MSHLAWHSLVMLFNILTFGTVFLVCLLIPTGRFVLGWTRWLVPAWVVWGLIMIFFPALPFLDLILNMMWMGELVGVMVALLYRYRCRSSPIQRQQTKWIVFGASASIVIMIVFKLPPLVFPALNRTGSLYDLFLATMYTLCLLPVIVCFAIAILHYRLWEIDVLINRTLVYGTLTVLLTLIYVGLVISLQGLVRLFSGQGSQSAVVIVASTLVIAALFQPLRQRIQRLIDRRFYRSKYDAAKTLAAFSATLRNEVDLDQLSEELVKVVQETMQPTHVSLWVRQNEQRRKPNIDA